MFTEKMLAFFPFLTNIDVNMKKSQIHIWILLGDSYLNGITIKQNYSKAIYYYEKAAEFNDSTAFFKLGNIYLYGMGVSKDEEKANSYYEKSINLNNTECLLHLAKIYFRGEIVPKDIQKAIRYYERSAELNDSTAILFLANFYLFSQEETNNFTKAKKYFELYSKTMNIKLNKNLNTFYIKSNFGLNIQKKLNWLNDITSYFTYSLLGFIFLIESNESNESFESIAQKNVSLIFLTIGNLYMFGQSIDRKTFYNPKMKEYIMDFFDLNDCLENNKLALFFERIIVKDHIFDVNINKKNYYKAKKYYEKAAELNDSNALNNVGCLYFYGLGVGQNYKKSIEFLEKAANLNNLTAYNNLATIFMKGRGVEKNYLKAIQYYEVSAKQNDLNALRELGLIYFLGKTNEKNLEKAIEYFNLSAKLNDPIPIRFLGDSYLKGEIVEKNYEKASECYEIAAKMNDFQAILKLLLLNLDENGDKQKAEKAIEYIKSPIFKDNSSSYLILGHLYYIGYYGDHDYLKAKEYYEEAAKLNNSMAYILLGNLYLYGQGVEMNLEMAKKHFKSSANLGDSNAYICLGLLYFNGIGGDKNYLKAREYFQLAVKLNNSYGYIYLGYLFYFGLDLEQSYIKAKNLYELAANSNNPDAFNELGNLYFYGKGVKKNYSKAKKLYEIAIKYNNSNAFINLGIIYYYGFGVKKNYSKALEYFKSSVTPKKIIEVFYDIFLTKYSESGNIVHINVNGYNYLGIMYLHGLGVVKDVPRSKYYFELAAKNGNLCALHNIATNFCYNENGQINIEKMLQYLDLPIRGLYSESLVYLGKMFLNGQNYENAKYYFELAKQKDHPLSYLYLGDIYCNGYGVEKNYSKFKYFYELAAYKNVSQALFRLGHEYFTGHLFQADYQKAKQYLLKCINITEKQILEGFYRCDCCPFIFESNANKYFSYNELGLIYLIALNVVNNAKYYMKEAAFSEFPFGQNNYGLLNQFYLNDMDKAISFFNRASEHNFSLSFYNLGYIKEKEKNDIEEAVDFYIKASDAENEQMIFQDTCYIDESLIISKKLILCFTNLKLANYFLSKSEIEKSKGYFIKAFSKLYFKDEKMLYNFRLRIDNDSIIDSFSYLKKFILNFPPFNLKNQPNLNLNEKYFDLLNENMDIIRTDTNNITQIKSAEELFGLDLKTQNKFLDKMKYKLKKLDGNDELTFSDDLNDEFHHDESEALIFEDSGKFFDFVVRNNEYKVMFINEIQSIIQIMESILYTPPYSILFGRINIEKTRFHNMENSKSVKIDINELFYEGFELKI